MQSEERAVDIDAAIDNKPLGAYQRVIICLCSLTVVCDGFDNQNIGVLAPSIAKNLHLNVVHFGTVFSAGLFGWTIGALSMGLIADRFGRRWMIILSAITFGSFSILTTRATTLPELEVLWFCTGLGLGGAVPGALALATEFAPNRLESKVAGWVMVGMPSGAILGGLTSTLMLPIGGWHSVLYIGGALPLLMAVAFSRWLPESPRFLVAVQAEPERLKRVMARVLRKGEIAGVARFYSARAAAKDAPVRQLFTEDRAADTLLFWLAFFGNLLILYFVVNWFPAMLQGAGMSIRTAIIATTLYSVGGATGAFSGGYLMSAFGRRRAPIVLLLLSMALIGVFANEHTAVWFVWSVSVAIGFAVQGAQTGLNALAAAYYPTSMRSTGLGWALGMGRIGAIVGPLLGELMLSLHWSLQQIFMSAIIPSLVSVLALSGIAVRHRRRRVAVGLADAPGPI